MAEPSDYGWVCCAKCGCWMRPESTAEYVNGTKAIVCNDADRCDELALGRITAGKK